jgi:GT2 family glycosyltransferase
MVSVVVLSYNRCAEVLFTIDKLKTLSNTLPFVLQIIVIDNASVDETSQLVANRHPDIDLITIKKNVGIAGWNEGFKIASEPYLLVLDDDSHIESGLAEAVDFMEQNADTGILALNITGGNYETSNWKDKKEAIGFIGCGALISSKVYERIGGFAEWLYVYGHEWEYGIRAIDAGFKIRFFKNSNVIHRTSTLNRTSKRLRMYSTRNEMGIVYKHFRTDRLLYVSRVWINSMKVISAEGFMASWYCFLGGFKFLKLRGKLVHTPVSAETQRMFADIFWGTQPAFGFIKKGLKRLLGKNKGGN